MLCLADLEVIEARRRLVEIRDIIARELFRSILHSAECEAAIAAMERRRRWNEMIGRCHAKTKRGEPCSRRSITRYEQLCWQHTLGFLWDHDVWGEDELEGGSFEEMFYNADWYMQTYNPCAICVEDPPEMKGINPCPNCGGEREYALLLKN